MVKYIKHTKITQNINKEDFIRNLKINICNRLIEGQTSAHEVATMLASKKKKLVIKWPAWQAQKGEGKWGGGGGREKSTIR